MAYRYIDADGREHSLPDAASFGAAVRTGRIQSDTMVFADTHGTWARADALPEFHAASEPADVRRHAAWVPSESDLPPAPDEPQYEDDLSTGAGDPAHVDAAPASADGGLSERVQWIIALLLLVVTAALVEPGHSWVTKFGYATGLLLGAYLVAWVALRWFRNGVLIPVGAILLTAFMVWGEIDDRRQTVERVTGRMDELEGNVGRVVSGDGGLVVAGVPSSNASVDEKLLWLSSQVLVDMEKLSVRVQELHGAIDSTMLTDFLTPEYVANAARYPDVGRYFDAYLEFLLDWPGVVEDSLPVLVARRMAEVGLDQPQYASLRATYADSMWVGFSKQRPYLEAARAFALAGKQLHAFLVAHDEFIVVDPTDGMAAFVRDDGYDEYMRYAGSYDDAVAWFEEEHAKLEEFLFTRAAELRSSLTGR